VTRIRLAPDSRKTSKNLARVLGIDKDIYGFGLHSSVSPEFITEYRGAFTGLVHQKVRENENSEQIFKGKTTS
jgi:hypothetical protein